MVWLPVFGNVTCTQLLMHAIAHWGLYGQRKRVCTGRWLWEKVPFPYRGLEPASVLRLTFQCCAWLYQLMIWRHPISGIGSGPVLTLAQRQHSLSVLRNFLLAINWVSFLYVRCSNWFIDQLIESEWHIDWRDWPVFPPWFHRWPPSTEVRCRKLKASLCWWTRKSFPRSASSSSRLCTLQSTGWSRWAPCWNIPYSSPGFPDWSTWPRKAGGGPRGKTEKTKRCS